MILPVLKFGRYHLGMSPCPGCNRHHQDYYIFSRGSQPKPSFATGILGGVVPTQGMIWTLQKNIVPTTRGCRREATKTWVPFINMNLGKL